MMAPEWPRWFFRETNPVVSTLVSMLLLAVAATLVVWGTTLVSNARRVARDRCREGTPCGTWHTFDFWLGCWILADATLYMLLGVATVRARGDPLDLWVALYFTAVALPAIRAFFVWARERLPERGP